MGCGKKHKEKDYGYPKARNCVCDAIKHIHVMQEEAEDKCASSCYSNLLSPDTTMGDTVPFILFCKKDCGKLFKTFGNIGGLVGPEGCFKTVFFRVENVKNDCCATLSLLRPLDKRGNQLDDLDNPCDRNLRCLEKTDICIEVDLDCFCAIQCLSPELVIG
ncbi:spore coat protein [Bacillaceae bacterium SIJ1]|uniref:CotY/CotZ family spore coat protein n=1 Tax=Litoribacterium kuwaitense TaxID=1398745 RepID=UPI0013E9E292|nr:CotY/CotZ family spore coat protein [Litoribacterium kuwaitense]NGP46156.1 spore coat protein [Litoribacterium kuwaitense]